MIVRELRNGRRGCIPAAADFCIYPSSTATSELRRRNSGYLRLSFFMLLALLVEFIRLVFRNTPLLPSFWVRAALESAVNILLYFVFAMQTVRYISRLPGSVNTNLTTRWIFIVLLPCILINMVLYYIQDATVQSLFLYNGNVSDLFGALAGGINMILLSLFRVLLRCFEQFFVLFLAYTGYRKYLSDNDVLKADVKE